MQKKIVVVGSINLDLVARVERIPARGETISGLDFQTFYGGKGANQAVAAAKLGAPVAMIGKLGDDVFAAKLRAGLAEAGVDVSCVENVPGSSGVAVITTTTEADNSIIVVAGANAKLSPEDLDRHTDTIRGAAIVLSQLEIPQDTVCRLGQLTQEAGIPFMLDPAPVRPLSEELLRTVTWLTPNETETRLLLGIDSDELNLRSAPEMADRLLARGVRNVILKLGGNGVYLAGKDVKRCHVPAFVVHAVDTTAAGDAFNGAFAYGLTVRGLAPEAAAEFACGVAALSVTQPGAQASMPTLLQAEQFLAQQTVERTSR